MITEDIHNFTAFVELGPKCIICFVDYFTRLESEMKYD